jgi:hypothetical protein
MIRSNNNNFTDQNYLNNPNSSTIYCINRNAVPRNETYYQELSPVFVQQQLRHHYVLWKCRSFNSDFQGIAFRTPN